MKISLTLTTKSFTTEAQRHRENLKTIKHGLNVDAIVTGIKYKLIQFLKLTFSVPLCLCGEWFVCGELVFNKKYA